MAEVKLSNEGAPPPEVGGTASRVPGVSVIVPNYNHARYLKQRLDSILAQTLTDLELILLDDASTDESVELLRRYATHPRVTHVVVNEQNTGSPSRQWERGIQLARGDWIWIAESDDYCDAGFLEAVLRARRPGVGLVYAQSSDVDEVGKVLGNRLEWTEEFSPNMWGEDFVCPGMRFVSEFLAVKNVIPNASAVVFEKRLYLAAAKPPPAMQMCADWFLWVGVAAQADVAFVSQRLNCFRHDPRSTRAPGYDRHLRRLAEKVAVMGHIENLTHLNMRRRMIACMVEWYRIMYYRGKGAGVLNPRLAGQTFVNYRNRFYMAAVECLWDLGWQAARRRLKLRT